MSLCESRMINRNNKFFEKAVIKGAEMARKNHYLSAYKMMEEIGLPYIVIERVLFEPHKIRSTD